MVYQLDRRTRVAPQQRWLLLDGQATLTPCVEHSQQVRRMPYPQLRMVLAQGRISASMSFLKRLSCAEIGRWG